MDKIKHYISRTLTELVLLILGISTIAAIAYSLLTHIIYVLTIFFGILVLGHLIRFCYAIGKNVIDG